MQLASGENETIPARRKVRVLLGKVRDGRGASGMSLRAADRINNIRPWIYGRLA